MSPDLLSLAAPEGSAQKNLHLRGYSPSIARAIERLRHDFDQPLRIEQMAREVGMSVSVFHHHFKAVTALSPSQFQKRLRLLEARRLMLGEDLDAKVAAYRVGYHDASHFTREYKSHIARLAHARFATAARRGAGSSSPMRKTRTVFHVCCSCLVSTSKSNTIRPSETNHLY